MRHLFVVDSLDKQMQNEKELIHLASAGVGGLFRICMKKSRRILWARKRFKQLWQLHIPIVQESPTSVYIRESNP